MHGSVMRSKGALANIFEFVCPRFEFADAEQQ